MGRKRNQGKARKAAKAKAKEEAEAEDRRNNNQTVATNGQEQPRAALSLLPPCPCLHGAVPPSDEDNICLQFAETFIKELSQYRGTAHNILNSLLAITTATMDKFADMWNDAAKMKTAISFFLYLGTQGVLQGSNDVARDCAAIARYLKEFIAVALKRTQPVYYWPKVLEAYYADMHTLVKFFRHRIPCSCLDEKYEEVKNITKMGICHNPNCKWPQRRVERNKTAYCSLCRNAVYCSRECQVADYTRHKPDCDSCVLRCSKGQV